MIFPHPVGIVLSDGMPVGERVKVFENETLSEARIADGRNKRHPQIADDSVIFAGTMIIGDSKVGKGRKIVANAVVLQKVPAGSTVVGVPTRPIQPERPVDDSTTASV